MSENRDDLHVVHVTPSIQEAFGGPTRSTTALCKSLARHGCRVDLCTVDWGSAFGRLIPVDASAIKLHVGKGFLLKRLWLSPGFHKLLRQVAAGADVIHNDGIWLGMSNAAARIARKSRIPEIVSIRGDLSAYSLRHSAWKKAIARRLYADRNIRGAACLHALTIQELNDIRANGIRNPVAIIPNGVDLEAFNVLPSRQAVDERWPRLRGKKIILYLSRISYSKGTQQLVEAWCRLAKQNDPWHLVIAGPDEFGIQAELEAKVKNSDCDNTVTFTGPAYGHDKLALFGAAEFFVLPSATEGFSMAILESLASRLPVMITPQCNFPEAHKTGAAILVDFDVQAVENGLREFMSMSDPQRREMGLHGRKLVEEKYTWDHVAGQMADVYRWMVGGGPAPASIQ